MASHIEIEKFNLKLMNYIQVSAGIVNEVLITTGLADESSPSSPDTSNYGAAGPTNNSARRRRPQVYAERGQNNGDGVKKAKRTQN